MNSSQAKSLVYMTFAALGGDPLAQMSLVCNLTACIASYMVAGLSAGT